MTAADFRRPRREGSVPRAAHPWAPTRRRVDWVRLVTWSALSAVSLVWVVALGWLLVQGAAWVLAVLA